MATANIVESDEITSVDTIEAVGAVDAKLVLVGDSGAGKTCIMTRYITGTFSDARSTIGASFMTKNVTFDDIKVRLQVWDTAGQERFRSLAPMYYRAAHAALIVYDVCSRDSYENVKSWITEIKSSTTKDCVLAIVGNKIDIPDSKRHVKKLEAMNYAQDIGALFFETSAKADIGISELFVAVSRYIVTMFQEESEREKALSRATATPQPIDIAQDKKPEPSCC